MHRLLLLGCLVLQVRATIIDRIAIAMGQQVITEQQIDEELRVTAFLNQQPIVRTLGARRAAADRLIRQLLVEREMELSHYPRPEEDDVNSYLQQIRQTFPGNSSFDRALAAAALTETVLKEHLALQLTALRFIEYRFRPDVGISDGDIQSYYQREIAAWKKGHPGAAAPSLASSRESIRKALLEERTDEMLDSWLEESRKRLNITYLDQSLQ